MLRLVHCVLLSVVAGEALATCHPPAVTTLFRCRGWGLAGSVLALESLKRALAPGNRGRDALVG